MRSWVDRRAIVFLCFALVCLVLIWPCPEQFRWVGVVMSTGYLVLAVMSWADHLGRWKSYDKH